MESVDNFIEQLLVDKGMTDLPADVKKELVEDMGERLLDQINKAAIMALPEDKAAELAEKTNDPDFNEEKYNAFLNDAGLDLPQITLQTMIQFRNFYLNSGE